MPLIGFIYLLLFLHKLHGSAAYINDADRCGAGSSETVLSKAKRMPYFNKNMLKSNILSAFYKEKHFFYVPL